MNSYWFRRLARDKEAKTMQDHGAKVVYNTLSFNDFIDKLNERLICEVKELSEAKGVDGKIHELIEVCEIIDAYRDTLALSEETLKEKRLSKKEDRGGFDKREYIEYIEVAEGSYFDNYCKKFPHKFPAKED